jgi:uncharacterized membrane protein
MEIESALVRGRQKLSQRGQWFGLSLCLVFGFLAFYLALSGYPALAGAIFTTTILSLAAVFVLGRFQPEAKKPAPSDRHKES